MSTDLVPSRTRSLVKQERQTAAVVQRSQLSARCANARIQAAAIAAHTGMTCLETLTALEIQAIKNHGSIIDERVRSVVDSYVALINVELSRLSLGGE